MQKYLHAVVSVTLIVAGLFSCTNPLPGTGFQSKQDSINFARAVYRLYAQDVANNAADTSQLPRTDGVHPITWDTVLAYQQFYDKDPRLLNLKNEPYKGFSIDANGFAWIKKNNAIQGLYLRLARKGDGSYTIMLLGTDSSGKILQKNSLRTAADSNGDPTNFDNTIPCPADCPVEPD